MAYGFALKDAVGTTRFSDADIGFQVLHEETLTASQTNVTFPFDLAYNSDYLELHVMFQSQTPNPQNAYNVTDITDYANYTGSITLSVYLYKGSGDSNYNCRLYVFGGDLASLTVQSVSL